MAHYVTDEPPEAHLRNALQVLQWDAGTTVAEIIEARDAAKARITQAIRQLEAAPVRTLQDHGEQ